MRSKARARRAQLLAGAAVLLAALAIRTSTRDPKPEKPGFAEPVPPERSRTTRAAAPDAAARRVDAPAAEPTRVALTPDEIAQVRTEIKISLAGLYTAEKSFYVENGRYTSDLAIAGWLPPNEKIAAKVGFLAPFEPKKLSERESPRRLDTDVVLTDQEFESRSVFEYGPTSEQVSLVRFREYCAAGCVADAEHFELLAVADFGNGKPEVWLINDKKEIRQVSNGEGGRETPP